MRKSLRTKKRMFRDFAVLKDKYVNKNHLKNLHSVKKSFCKSNDISWSHLQFLLWAYDLEFWTLKYAAKEYDYSEKKLGERIVYELVKQGYIYKHFDKMTPSNTMEDHLFREETKYNYRVRYAITQKARLLVQAFYRELES